MIHRNCKKLVASFILLVLSCHFAPGQIAAPGLAAEADSLQAVFKRIRAIKDDNQKQRLNDSLVKQVELFLGNPASYKLSLDSIKTLGKVPSPDNSFRILNWNISFNDNTYAYFTYIQFNPEGKYGYRFIKVKDNALNRKEIEQAQYNAGNWYGALVYKIIHTKDGRQNYYTLLSIEFNDLLSTYKLIDVITFGKNGDPLFGKPIFKTPEGLKSRIIFEYSAQATMGLRWDEKVSMIVFDHLSPIRPDMTGNFKFYGPDFSFDGFKFEKGFWVFQSDLNLKN